LETLLILSHDSRIDCEMRAAFAPLDIEPGQSPRWLTATILTLSPYRFNTTTGVPGAIVVVQPIARSVRDLRLSTGRERGRGSEGLAGVTMNCAIADELLP
jgi:hypothetical protein